MNFLLLKNVKMERMFYKESVLNVKVYVWIMHLVTSQPENVITDVVITGLENFVKVRKNLWWANLRPVAYWTHCKTLFTPTLKTPFIFNKLYKSLQYQILDIMLKFTMNHIVRP